MRYTAMTNRLLRAASSALILAAIARPIAAHNGAAGSSLAVEPSSVTAGGTVVLAGTGLEPDSARQINLVGPDVVVPFPSAMTDADGMFNVTLTIPGHLPSGVYTFQAIADETLTVDLTVTAAEGATPAEPKREAAAVVAPRDRSPIEVAAIAIVVLVSLGIGALLILRAERLGTAAPRDVDPRLG